MKKTTIAAAVGTTALGVAAATAGAAPAAAAPAPANCDSYTGHVPSSGGTFYDDSFFDCVPLYGVGKVEFDITSDVPFPAGFDISDETVTETVSSAGAAGNTYWAADPLPQGFTNLSLTSGDETIQTYTGNMIFAVSGVAAVDAAAPPAECTPGTETYGQAYTVSYTPATVDFTTTIDGEGVWEYEVSSAPSPLTLYMNIAADGTFVAEAPQCATNGTEFLVAESSSDGDWTFITTSSAGFLSPFPLAIDLGGGTALPMPADIGSYDGERAPIPEPTDEPEPEPELAATGAEFAAPATAAGLIALLGSVLLAVRRRVRA